MNESAYNEAFFAKVLAQELTNEELVAFKEACDQDEKLRSDFEAYQMIWQTEAYTDEVEVNVDDAWQQFKASQDGLSDSNVTAEPGAKVISISPSRRWLLAVAASVTLIAMLSIVYRLINAESKTVQVIASNALLDHTLPDGSLVSLSPGTRLSYDADFSVEEREVDLVGRAYFDVEPDAKRPFRVHTALGTVEVLGTEFEVQAFDGDSLFLVEVNEGKVAVQDPLKTERATVSGGEAARISSSRGLEVFEHLDPAAFFWKDRTLRFKKTSMHKVVEVLRASLKMEISIDAKIEACELTATFSDDDHDTVIEVIATTLGLSWTKEEGVYYLSGEGC